MGQYATKEVDPILSEEFKKVESDSILNETILLLLSDHGLHFGPHLGIVNSFSSTFFLSPSTTSSSTSSSYSESLEGQIEHKLPTFYMVAPKWWLKRNPEAGTSLPPPTPSHLLLHLHVISASLFLLLLLSVSISFSF